MSMATAEAEKIQFITLGSATIEVGARGISEFWMERLPVNSIISGTYRYLKIEPDLNRWRRLIRHSSTEFVDTRIRTNLRGMTCRLEKIGAPARTETFEEFKQRFSTAIIHATEEFSAEHQRIAKLVLAELGASPGGVQINSKSTPPVGTVVTHGSPDQKEFTVFRYGRKGWQKLAGYFETIDDANVVVASTPGVEPESVGDDEARIAAFKVEVWVKGQQVKQHNKWCSKYDEILAGFGIVDPGPFPDFSNWPTMIKGEEGRAELPSGAVLGISKGDWGVFEKVGEVWERRAGTRPLAAGTMHLLFGGHGDLMIENAGPLMDHLPAGAQIVMPSAHEHPEIPWTKTEEGDWVRPNEQEFKSSSFRDPVTVVAWS